MSNTRKRFQRGYLVREGVLVYHRFRETQPDGSTKNCKIAVGTNAEYPTDKKAWLAPQIVATLKRLNMENVIGQSSNVTVDVLLSQFTTKYCTRENLSLGTIQMYESFQRKWVSPRWGRRIATEIQMPEAVLWFDEIDLAPKSKNKLKFLLSILWKKSKSWGLLPTSTSNFWQEIQIKNATKRSKQLPDVLTPTEFCYILKATKKHTLHRAVIALAGCLGPRVSEILGLKWSDIDFTKNHISIVRGWTKGEITELKTEASQKEVPLHPDLAEIINEWRHTSCYNGDGDWIFASESMSGTQPLWSDRMRDDYLKGFTLQAIKMMRKDGQADLAAALAKKNVGWHTFRHTHKAWHVQQHTPLEIQRALLRHSDIRTTEMYGKQVQVTDVERQANNNVVEFAFRKKRAAGA